MNNLLEGSRKRKLKQQEDIQTALARKAKELGIYITFLHFRAIQRAYKSREN